MTLPMRKSNLPSQKPSRVKYLQRERNPSAASIHELINGGNPLKIESWGQTRKFSWLLCEMNRVKMLHPDPFFAFRSDAHGQA